MEYWDAETETVWLSPINIWHTEKMVTDCASPQTIRSFRIRTGENFSRFDVR